MDSTKHMTRDKLKELFN